MNRISKIALISLLTVVFCCSLAVGSTYGLFADKTNANIVVSSGTLNVTLSVPSFSFYYDNGSSVDDRWPEGGVGLFDDELVISKMQPGCIVSIDVHIKNSGTLAAKWQLQINCDNELLKYVTLSTNAELEFFNVSNSMKTAWQHIDASQDGQPIERTVTVFIELPNCTEQLSISEKVYISVNAVQGNAITTDPVNYS